MALFTFVVVWTKDQNLSIITSVGSARSQWIIRVVVVVVGGVFIDFFSCLKAIKLPFKHQSITAVAKLAFFFGFEGDNLLSHIYTRPNFFQPSSRIRLTLLTYNIRQTKIRGQYDWTVEKSLDCISPLFHTRVQLYFFDKAPSFEASEAHRYLNNRLGIFRGWGRGLLVHPYAPGHPPSANPTEKHLGVSSYTTGIR